MVENVVSNCVLCSPFESEAKVPIWTLLLLLLEITVGLVDKDVVVIAYNKAIIEWVMFLYRDNLVVLIVYSPGTRKRRL